MNALRAALGAALLATAATGCNGALDAHLSNLYGGAGATPAPTTPPGGAGAGACAAGGTATAATGADVVLMTSSAAVVTVPGYGTISGYVANDALANPTPPSFQAQTIAVSLAQHQYVALQFFNADASALHAAAGIAGSSFPPAYAFLTSPTGTAISANGRWATGPIAPSCYSAPFSLPTAQGAYPFGDPNGYADPTSPVRDVLQVSQ